MWKYILKRIISLIPVIIGVTFIVFFILNLAPGDPAKSKLGEQATPEAIEAQREAWGLNDPFLIRYGKYMLNLAKGDMGNGWQKDIPVVNEVFSRFPNTAKLAICATLITIVLALPLGILAAVKQNTLFDGVSMIIALIGVSMPIFWVGLLLIILFSLKLGWLPAAGAGSGWKSLILPSAALGFMHMATIARTTRSSMLEVIRQDYIRTARAKGLSNGVVIRKHALRNAMIPTITMIGLQLGQMLAGSVLTESVFAWPGIGRLMIQGINARDIPIVLGCIILFTLSFSIVNLIVDLLYAFVDPRIRSQYS